MISPYKWPARFGQGLIWLYQHTLSFDHGPLKGLFGRPVCRFHPTCSEYGHEAIGRFGLIKGSYLTAKRIGRCHPWNPGGNDPVPQK